MDAGASAAVAAEGGTDPLVADADGKAAAMDWWRDAACAHEDPELFFPVAVTGAALRDQQARAKAICRRCPVIRPCLTWALQATGAQGVWGGTCEEERRGLLRGRAQGESALGVTGSA
ncbi:WhiB family transcriptional regulator [Streptomyces sp. NPDC008159]|uniref:WhiB family transcriptional regulator n=1 Tax=Streptomyces sp. NPDC008159 TaxID=3364817 RepID=UPI0036E0BB55